MFFYHTVTQLWTTMSLLAYDVSIGTLCSLILRIIRYVYIIYIFINCYAHQYCILWSRETFFMSIILSYHFKICTLYGYIFIYILILLYRKNKFQGAKKLNQENKYLYCTIYRPLYDLKPSIQWRSSDNVHPKVNND